MDFFVNLTIEGGGGGGDAIKCPISQVAIGTGGTGNKIEIIK